MIDTISAAKKNTATTTTTTTAATRTTTIVSIERNLATHSICALSVYSVSRNFQV